MSEMDLNLPSNYYGCASGDCPHDTVQECFDGLLVHADELHGDTVTMTTERDDLQRQLDDLRLSHDRWKQVAEACERADIAANTQHAEKAELFAARNRIELLEVRDEAGIAECTELRKQHAADVEKIDAMKAALTPSGETKAAYVGEVEFNIGSEHERMITVPWTATKELMAMIRKRAAQPTESEVKDVLPKP